MSLSVLLQAVLTIGIAASLVTLAQAGEGLTIVPAVSVKEEYNDNIHFGKQKKGSFITAVSPKVSLLQRSERLSVDIAAILDVLYYSSATDLNTTDQNYWGTASYQFSPRFKAAASAGYMRDSPTDRILEASGLVIRTPREQQDYSVVGKYLFDEKLGGSLTYAYQQINYNTSLLTDIYAHFFNLGLEYDLDRMLPYTKVRGEAGYNHADYSTPAVEVAKVDTFSLSLGASRLIHELWTVSADVGTKISEFTFYSPKRSTDQRVGWTARSAVEYRDDKTSGNLSFYHNLQSLTGYAVPTEQTSVTAQVNRRFTYELTGMMYAGYFLSSSENNNKIRQTTDQRTYLVSPGVSYDFTRNLKLNFAYEYAYLDDRRNNERADRNRGLAIITYQIPIPLY